MTHLIITRGYPASGKTTLARQWVAREVTTYDVDGPRARVNRDDLRAMVGITTGVGTPAQEQMVTTMQRAQVRALLKDGVSVIVDDTNLRLRFARDWADLAAEQGATFGVYDLETPWEICVERDLARRDGGGRHVGEDVIRMLAQKFPISRWEPVVARPKTRKLWDPVEWDNLLEPVWLVDIDGTIAKKRQDDGSRGWHEYERVGEDLPHQPVIDLLRAILSATDRQIIFMSGRKEHCRRQTRTWLEEHVGRWTMDCALYMRADEDNRSDDLVKYELFNEHIRGQYNVVGVLDDRDRVVAMWRALGLFVAQVDYGDF